MNNQLSELVCSCWVRKEWMWNKTQYQKVIFIVNNSNTVALSYVIIYFEKIKFLWLKEMFKSFPCNYSFNLKKKVLEDAYISIFTWGWCTNSGAKNECERMLCVSILHVEGIQILMLIRQHSWVRGYCLWTESQHI